MPNLNPLPVALPTSAGKNPRPAAVSKIAVSNYNKKIKDKQQAIAKEAETKQSVAPTPFYKDQSYLSSLYPKQTPANPLSFQAPIKTPQPLGRSEIGFTPSIGIPKQIESINVFSATDNLMKEKAAISTPTITDKSVGLPEIADTVFRTFRAGSELASTPIAGAINLLQKPEDRVNYSDLAEQQVEKAKRLIKGEDSFSSSVEQAADMYLKNRRIGKYGGEEINFTDIVTLSALGFVNMFGDPLMEFAALKSLGKSAEEFATWKKMGKVEKTLPEGMKVIEPKPFDIPLNNELKIKVEPKGNKVILQGYAKRGAKGEIVFGPRQIETMAEDISKQTGIRPEIAVKGNDVVLTGMPGKTLETAPISKGIIEQAPQSLKFGGILPPEQSPFGQTEQLLSGGQTPKIEPIQPQIPANVEPTEIPQTMTEPSPVALPVEKVVEKPQEIVETPKEIAKVSEKIPTKGEELNIRKYPGDEPIKVTSSGSGKIAGNNVFVVSGDGKGSTVYERTTGLMVGQSRYKNPTKAIEEVNSNLLSKVNGDENKLAEQFSEAIKKPENIIINKEIEQPIEIKQEKIPAIKQYESILKKQIGDIFNVVEPVGSLWKSKDNVLFIKPNRERAGLIDWLRGKNFIDDVQEAGNNVFKVTVKKELSKTQSQKVAETIKESPKTIKQIAEETKILEPNVRRILGVGAKEGTFSRIDKGVYILSKDGVDTAWVHTGDALEILPKLADDGLKADMVFLDIPYNAEGNRGGNRMNTEKGTLYKTISPEQFKTAVDSITRILKSEDSPLIYMFSQSKSSVKTMEGYSNVLLKAGYKPLAKGDYYKMTKGGKRFTIPMRSDFLPPEGIIIFNKTGEYDVKKFGDLQYKLVRPAGYKTEKPAELLKSLIEMTTNEGDVILDPFAGSGVTGEQAIKAGRKAVLIEENVEAVEKHIKPRIEKVTKEVKKKVEETTTEKVAPKDFSKTRYEISPEDKALQERAKVLEKRVNDAMQSGGLAVKETIELAQIRKQLREKEMSFTKYGDSGGYKDIDTDSVTVEFNNMAEQIDMQGKTIKPIQAPEMYKLVKEVEGTVKFILKNYRSAWGKFYPLPEGAKIGLSRKLFRTHFLKDAEGEFLLDEAGERIPESAAQKNRRIAKTFAHEIGHLVDFLPDKIMTRGNLIGRLLVMKKFRKVYIGDESVLKERNKLNRERARLEKQIKENVDVAPSKKELEIVKDEIIEVNKKLKFNNKVYQEELQNLTQAYKPFDVKANKDYTAYRHSSPELYADYISALFNNPKIAKDIAPTFFKDFFLNLDKKPKIQKAFFELQALMNGDRLELMEARWKDLVDSSAEAQTRFWHMREEYLAQRKNPIFSAVIRDYYNKHYWAKKYGNKAEIIMEESDRGSANQMFLQAQKYFKEPVDIMNKYGISSNEMSALLIVDRIAGDTGRYEVANIFGHDKVTATEVRDYLKEKYGPEKGDAFFKSAQGFRDGLKNTMLSYPDLYKPEMLEKIKESDFYAPFNIMMEWADQLSPALKQQTGNIDVGFNAMTNLLNKFIGVVKYGERNITKNSALDIIKLMDGGLDKAEIIRFEDKQGNIHQEVKESRDPRYGVVQVMNEGKMNAYVLPIDIADDLNNGNLYKAGNIVKILNAIQSPFKAAYTTLKPAFQIVNFFFRDTGTASLFFSPEYKRLQEGKSNLNPFQIAMNLTVRNALSAITQKVYQAKAAKQLYDFHINKNVSDKIQKALEDNIISFNQDMSYYVEKDLLDGDTEAAAKALFTKLGLTESTKVRYTQIPFTDIYMKNTPLEKWNQFYDFMQSIGNIGEETNKLATRMYFDDMGWYSGDRGKGNSIVRRYSGSPNFWAQGRKSKQLGSVIMFFNAIKEGLKSNYELAFVKDAAGKGSRSAFWWRMIKAAILPAIAITAAEQGMFGDDNKKMTKLIPDYLKNNYINIPLDMKNGKTRHISIPMDEQARLVHAITRIALNAALNKGEFKKASLLDLLAFSAGQLPSSLNPALELGAVWGLALQGFNPYDLFTNQTIFYDTEMDLPASEKAKILAKWTLNKTGVFKLEIHDTVDNKTILEKTTQIPVAGPLLGTFVRSSNRGSYEIAQKYAQEGKEQVAIMENKRSKMINNLTEKILKSKETIDVEGELSKIINSTLLPGYYDQSDINSKMNNAFEQVLKKVAKSKNNQFITTVGQLRTSYEKINLIKKLYQNKEITAKETTELVNTLLQYKMLSKPDALELSKTIGK